MNSTNRANITTWNLWRDVERHLAPATPEDIDIVLRVKVEEEKGRSVYVGNLVRSGIAPRNTVLRRIGSLLRRQADQGYNTSGGQATQGAKPDQ